jgi:hypothetical protein
MPFECLLESLARTPVRSRFAAKHRQGHGLGNQKNRPAIAAAHGWWFQSNRTDTSYKATGV